MVWVPTWIMHQQLIGTHWAFKIKSQQIHNPSDRAGEVRVLIFLFHCLSLQSDFLFTLKECVQECQFAVFHILNTTRIQHCVPAEAWESSKENKGCAAEYWWTFSTVFISFKLYLSVTFIITYEHLLSPLICFSRIFFLLIPELPPAPRAYNYRISFFLLFI